MARITRRRFIGIAAGGASASAIGALAFGMRPAGAPEAIEDALDAAAAATIAPTTTATSVPTSIPTPTPIPEPPVMPRGREVVSLMAGTEWEATGTIFHSGVAGPRFMVLGGVHGNEPGGWMGAEGVATWEVDRGMLIVLPRINHRAAAAFERTLDGIGDLNRLYPGDPNGVPMARMAYEITKLAEQWRPHWFWDMHESWGFFNERGENSGTAFIGQTVTAASSASAEAVERAVERVNGAITPREAFTMRLRIRGVFGGGGGSGGGGALGEPEDGGPRRASSSLSIGNYVAGVNPVLIEMGQMNQPEWRRAELHQMLVRAMMEDAGAFASAPSAPASTPAT